MKIDVSFTAELEPIEGQTNQDVFEMFMDFLTDCAHDHEMFEKFSDLEVQRVD